MADEIQKVESAIPFAQNGVRPEDDYPGGGPGGIGMAILNWVVSDKATVPPYWSYARDKWLREFVHDNGPLKTAVATFVNKAVTIPWDIRPRDPSIPRHVRQAQSIRDNFNRYSGSMSSSAMKGWKAFYKAFWFDYVTQDNGAFALVLGDGPSDGPIVGAPIGLMHLDSSCCIRTKSMEFPIKYRHTDGREYKLHHTRVIEMANLPSADVRLNGVGLSAVSCCIEAAQELWDIYRYSSEKFGSRPPRQILYVKKGGTYDTLSKAVMAWNLKLNEEQRTHFGGTLLMGPVNARAELDIGMLPLNSEPENFNRRDVTTIDKSEIAAAFGLDLRDMAYIMGAPSRTGDAEVQDRKGRGKGVGEAIETFSERFEEICINRDLFTVNFDYLDDEQDEQHALIRDKRSQARERDLRAGVTTIRVEREKMWNNREISQEQFDEMELLDGRLPNGLDVLLLFQSQDADFQEWLDVGVADPTNAEANDAAAMIETVHMRIIELSEQVHGETKPERIRKARQALAALEKLLATYQAVEETAMLDEQAALEGMDAGTETTEDGSRTTEVTDRTTEDRGRKTESSDRTTEDVTKQVEIGEDEIDAILRDYHERFRNLSERVERGDMLRTRFEEALADLVTLFLLSLFQRGSRTRYVEMTRDEIMAVQEGVNVHLPAIRSLSDDIYTGRYAQDPDAVLRRIDTWLNVAAGTYYQGQTFRRDDPYLRWEYGPTEHCADCLRLHGQVHRASAWRASGLYPRAFVLQCTGVHCQCRLIESTGPEVGTF